jgi:putative endonuclease
MSDKIKRGNEGEQLAADFLLRKGFEIVERNYRHKHSEIDAIARMGNLLVFVEVKTRSSSDFGHPEEFVDSRKRKKILEGADHYLHETNWQGNVRYDIVSINLNTGSPEVVHIEDAFY